MVSRHVHPELDGARCIGREHGEHSAVGRHGCGRGDVRGSAHHDVVEGRQAGIKLRMEHGQFGAAGREDEREPERHLDARGVRWADAEAVPELAIGHQGTGVGLGCDGGAGIDPRRDVAETHAVIAGQIGFCPLFHGGRGCKGERERRKRRVAQGIERGVVDLHVQVDFQRPVVRTGKRERQQEYGENAD
jgi:hypothetical protein